MIKKVEGIVYTSKDYSETSKIVNILTKDGIISLIAKGSRNLKSQLRCVNEKLTYGTFNIYYKEDKLSTLSSVDIIDNFKNIKKDITKISYASYLLELATQVMKHSNNSGVYDLLINGLIKINEGYDPLVIMNIIELKYLSYLGVMPVLDSCCKCGSKTIKTLSGSAGGYICERCYINEEIVSEKTIKLIRMFCYVDISKILNIDINNKIKNEINNFIDDYYDRYTGLYLKSKIFLKNLNKVNWGVIW